MTRFSVSLWFYLCYNNLSRKQNRAFAPAHPNCRIPATCAGKVNAARVVWCALKKRAAEENSDGQRQKPRAVGLFSNSRQIILSAQNYLCELRVL